MRELICIVCPSGCPLTVKQNQAADANSGLEIAGNLCPRGVSYAQEEIRSPKRTVTATCAVILGESAAGRSLYAPRRVPVKTSAPCPKEKIPALLADVYSTKVTLPIKVGDLVIADWKGCGIDVVATRSLA